MDDRRDPGTAITAWRAQAPVGVELTDFAILGPISFVNGTSRTFVSSNRQRTVLAILLLEPNRLIGIETMIDALWRESPPKTARTQIQICISLLRKTFSSLGLGEAAIVTEPSGYVLMLEDGRLDAQVFAQMTAAAEVLAANNRLEDAVDQIRHGLALWSGPALAGVDSAYVRAKAARMDEERLVALEMCAEWELRLGRHQSLISELAERVIDHPLREHSRGQLMLALYRAGRQAEALEVYAEGRRALVEQLGLEPGEDLRQLEALIHTNSPSLTSVEWSAGVKRTVPNQLPSDIQDFTGRDNLIRRMYEALVGGSRGEPNHVVPVVVAVGCAGSGKSALVVHVAHRLAARHFPDGVLYANLGGSLAHSQPAEVLGRFLRALDMPHTAIPDSLEARAEIFRIRLAGKKFLLILDDAVSESQVRLLVPGTSGCAVLVTSRMMLTGLPATKIVHVGRLEDEWAIQMLGKVAGNDRTAAEPAEAKMLVRLVDRLPLGLRIMGARLVAHPHWTLASMVDRLSDEHHRLDELAHGDLVMRSTISSTYVTLGPLERRMICLISGLELDDFPAWVAAALLDTNMAEAVALLDTLVDAHMLDLVAFSDEAHARYKAHKLIAVFAREQLRSESPRLLQKTISRVCGGWLAMVEQAHQRLYGGQFTVLHGGADRWQSPTGLPEIADPLSWLEAERHNLFSAVEKSASVGLDEVCWDLAMSLVTLFETRNYFNEWESTHRLALVAARSAGNRRGEAAMLCSLGSLFVSRRRVDEAVDVLAPALQLFTELGDRHGRALALRSLGATCHLSGDVESAQARYQQAIVDFQMASDPIGEAHSLASFAETCLDTGEPELAREQLQYALRICRAVGNQRVEAQILHRLANVLLAQGRDEDAERQLLKALEFVSNAEDKIGEMHVIHALGRVGLAQTRFTDARRCLQRALALCDKLSDASAAAMVRVDLGRLLSLQDAPQQARMCIASASRELGRLRLRGWERHARAALQSLS